jgi:tetratricopeptide (TPR) repeat protein
MVARDVLEHAHNLSETLEILRHAKVFVSTLWLIGSRADGKFVVVEKTPDSTQVRETEGDSTICANHFQTAGLRDDPRNTNYIAEATSVSREARLAELMRPTNGVINVSRAVEFLRDRDLPGGAFAGNGHRSALNALIATHATVMDLTEGIFWAASPPNQLGEFVAFDVRDFSHELPERTVPADPVLASGEFERARQAQKCLADGQRALHGKDAKAALALAEEAESLNPGFYQNAALRGRALLALNRNQEAAASFERALTAHPAFLKEKKELEELLRQSRAAK